MPPASKRPRSPLPAGRRLTVRRYNCAPASHYKCAHCVQTNAASGCPPARLPPGRATAARRPPAARQPHNVPHAPAASAAPHPTEQTDSVFVNEEFLQFYTKIISIRNKNDAIKTGSFKFIKWDNQKDILVVERKLNNEVLLIAFNNLNSEQNISLPASSYKNISSWIDLYDNKKFEIKNGNINLILAGKGWIILKSL